MSTTSAASDDAVAPRAPIATPTSASARAGASLMPSPTMIVLPGAALEPDRVDLLGRRAFGEDFVDADDRTDGLRVLFAVAGHHDDAADAVAAQLADRARGVGADRVVEQQRADGHAVDLDEDRERAVELGAAAHGLAPSSALAGAEIQLALPTATRWPSTMPAHAVTGHLLDVVGQRQREAARAGAPVRPRRRARAARPGRGWRRSAGRRRRSCRVAVTMSATRGSAGGDRAGLVEQQDLAARRAARARRRPSRRRRGEPPVTGRRRWRPARRG